MTTTLVLLAWLAASTATAAAGALPVWAPAERLATPRGLGHTATLLANGNVLVVGGDAGEGGGASPAEVYDPGRGKWTTTPPLNARRSGHTATLLTDGRVLVAGGAASPATAEIYDPASGQWTTTKGALRSPRDEAMAVLVAGDNCAPNCGKVLVTGGRHPSLPESLASAELYDPRSDTWANTAEMARGRSNAVAVVLSGAGCATRCGDVLVAGGLNRIAGHLDSAAAASAELFDPATATWTPTGPLAFPRLYAQGVAMADGKVLVAGGTGPEDAPDVLPSQLYDPATGTWSEAGPLQKRRLLGHRLARLGDGRILVVGAGIAEAEVYDPAKHAWELTAGPSARRVHASATLLACGAGGGRVLVVGGAGDAGGGTAEMYQPEPAPAVPPCTPAQVPSDEGQQAAVGDRAATGENESSTNKGLVGAIAVAALAAGVLGVKRRSRSA